MRNKVSFLSVLSLSLSALACAILTSCSGASAIPAKPNSPAKTTPTITWAQPAPITNPAPLGPAQLNATANVPGTFAYNPPAGTVLDAGTHTLSATFTPTDTGTYNNATASVTLTVNPAPSPNKTTPTITWAQPAPITNPTPLGPTQLDATASVPGTFAYTPPGGTVLDAGTHTLSVTFTPTDTNTYNTASASVTIVVNPAAPPPSTNFQLTFAFSGNGTGAVVSTPTGISCRTGSNSGCSASFASGTSIKLAVTPDSSMVLAGWQGGGCSGTAPTCTLTLSADTRIVVTLNQAPPPPPANAQLTVIESGGGQGSVVSTPAGINCPGTCTATFAEGTQVTLNATAANGSTFGGFTGACTTTGARTRDPRKSSKGYASPSPTCTFAANGNESVTADFTTVQPPPPPPPTASVSVTITGKGTVTSSPAGIDCPTTCNANFAQGTVVTLTSTDTVKGWQFWNWAGACADANTLRTCQLTISSTDQSVTAVFRTPDLIYRGGPVMPTTTTKAIFWGVKWGDPAFVADKISGLDSWYEGVGGSSYAGSVDEYTDSTGQHVTANSTYTGHIIDTTPATDSGALAEACKLVPNPSPDEYVAVYLDEARPWNWCAYHTYASCTSSSGSTQMVVSVFYNLDTDGGCNANDTVTGHSQGLASLGNMSGHEFSEARSDPQLTSWTDSNGSENADKCSWLFTDPFVTFSNGTKWKIQDNWSNYAHDNAIGKELTGCVNYNVTGQ